jgi:DNA helicase-2/ATP-dependent DNA helicase PcrA
MSTIDIETALNQEQQAAVLAADGPVLVIAAAGTGKTRTLTYRVAHLVDRGEDPQRILLLTFTNRAAGEMLERAAALVGERVGGLWGGTFHHMANRILRRYASRLGYDIDYTILDQEDATRLVRACANELDLTGKHFPKPKVLMGLFGLASSREVPIEQVAEERFTFHEISIEQIAAVRNLYQRRKRDQNAMDFDDLLSNALILFREHPDVAEMYQRRFRHVLVDEYQDTNAIQSDWVDLLAAGQRNLLVVGDDFQSIYSWRGADFRNIMTFPERYPDAQMFKLETNYRSVPEILDVANACIAGNPEQYQKNLRAVRDDHVKPIRAETNDGMTQAGFIVDCIRKLRREGYQLKDIAVLYRAHFHAMDLQLQLPRADIAYTITSGIRFFEQAHIKDVCTLPRLIANAADELSFLRLLEMLPRVGAKTAARIWKALGGKFDTRRADVRKLIIDRLPGAAREFAHPILDVFADYHEGRIDDSLTALLERFVDGFYDQFAVENFDNYNRRMDDIRELVVFASRFSSVHDFLSEMALLSNVDGQVDPKSPDAGNAIRLSTIHQAKGLEWKVVFVLWVVDGMFPAMRALEQPGAEAEERRLFYVAITRAKDSLYLCIPFRRRCRDGGFTPCMPSRFINELPEDLLETRYSGI